MEQHSVQEKRYNDLLKLIEITKIINATLDIGKLLANVMEAIKGILVSEASSLLFYDESTKELIFKVATGDKGEKLTERYRFKDTEGIAGWSARNKKSIIINDVYSDHRFNPTFDKITGFKTEAIICAPLLFKGKLIGVAEGVNPIGRKIFTEDDLYLFDLFAEQAVMAVQNAITFETSIERIKLQTEMDEAKASYEILIKADRFFEGDVEFAVTTKSARQFSGDFFLHRRDSENLVFFLADSGTRGLTGALKGSFSSGYFLGQINNQRSPGHALARFYSDLADSAAETMKSNSNALLSFSINEKRLNYAAAGSIHLLLVRKGEIRKLRTNCNPPANEFSTRKIVFQDDDLLVVFTEGITSISDKKAKRFGIEGVVRSVNADLSAQENLAEILSRVNEHAEKLIKFDDITLLCVKF